MREARTSGAPWVSKSTHPIKFGNHVTVHRTNERPSVLTTGIPMFNLTLSGKFGSTGKLILYTYCTSKLLSIDSCQNRISADQYHLTVSRAQVSTHRGRVFFWSYPLNSCYFSNDRRLKLSFFFQTHMKYVVFMCRTIHSIRILRQSWDE